MSSALFLPTPPPEVAGIGPSNPDQQSDSSERNDAEMRRSDARLMLRFTMSTLALAGCASDTHGEGVVRDGDSSVVTTREGSIEVLPGGQVRFPVEDGPPPFGADSPAVSVDAPAAIDDSPRGEDCDPNYDPCVPIDSDVDCKGGGGNGPSYVAGPVRVIGHDPYRLDRDGDGVGCEN